MNLLRADQDLTRHSFYAATAAMPPVQRSLKGSVDCDVAVVGGGLAGVSAALELAERGHQVVLLEARRIGGGASGRNGGQAIHGLACDQTVIEAQLGLEDSRRIWDMTIEALDLIRRRIERYGIACDWRDGYLGVAVGPGKARELMASADRMERLYRYPLNRIGAKDLGRWIASPRYEAGVHDPRCGHLHPLKYVLGLARAAAAAGARIYEDSPVVRLDQGSTVVLQSANGQVRARQALLAGNVYLQGLVPKLQSRVMPVGTYIVASEALEPALARSLIPCGAAVCDTNFVLDYFRLSPDTRRGDHERLLFGGRVSYTTATPMNMAHSMRRRMLAAFPQLQGKGVEHAWGGFVDISMNRAPDFGRLPAHQHVPNVYYLQGFSGHGLALTGLAGQLVAEAMSGDASRFDVFARLRHRSFPGGPWLRMPALVLGTAWYRLKDAMA